MTAWRRANYERLKSKARAWSKKSKRYLTIKRWVHHRVEKLLHPERYTAKQRGKLLKREYGLTLDEYDRLNIKQNGLCAICFKKETRPGKDVNLSVDHCHTTGRVRGLLCSSCNLALGQLGDDPARMLNMIAYLANHPEV